MTTDRPVRPVLRLDGAAFRALTAAHQLDNDQDIARHVGVSASTLSRCLHEGVAGARFVAAVLYAFPDASFGDLFSVTLHSVQAEAP